MSTAYERGRSGSQAAAASSEHEGERRLQQMGRDLIFALHAGLRALKLYPLENQAVQNALRELVDAADALHQQDGGLSLRYVGNFFFVNDLRLRSDMGSFATFGALSSTLQRHGIGQLEGSPEAGAAEWTALLSLLLADAPDAGDDAFARFRERLERSAVRHLEVLPVADAEARGPAREQDREAARRCYAQSVAVARETMSSARLGKGVSLRRVKRAVQSIVDQVLDNESMIMGMTVLRDYDQYTFAHSVNVCIFSVALGKKLELTRHQLYELGMGSLLHDMGKVMLPIELTTKQGQLDEPEWDLVREHPTEGLLKLLEMRQFGELPLRAMLLAYEHHMKVDLTGYPSSVREREPTLFSRIVAIADGFDAATTKRSYQAVPWLPDDVLREMRDNQRRGFDPLLVKAFISMSGYYPIGSLAVLDSYELAVVIARNPDEAEVHRPIVKIIYDEMGLPLGEPQTVNLAELDPATGEPRRTIIKTTDPEQYGINIKDYFV